MKAAANMPDLLLAPTAKSPSENIFRWMLDFRISEHVLRIANIIFPYEQNSAPNQLLRVRRRHFRGLADLTGSGAQDQYDSVTCRQAV